MHDFNDTQLRILEKGKISCRDYIKLLGDYTDNDVAPTLRARLDAHEHTCPVCQHLKATYNFTIDLAKELRDEPPLPADVRARLRRNLSERLGIELPPI